MRHARFDVATLAVDGASIALKAAYLLVVEREGTTEPEWECVAYALDPAPIPRGRSLVDVTALDGRRLSGPAIVVRSVDGAHVLRGDGPLAGVSGADFG